MMDDQKKVKMTKVEGACWDITVGLAGTSFGKWILSITSSSEESAPDAVDHVGIVAYGYLYEYGDLGILKAKLPTSGDPESQYPVSNFRSRESLGQTKKSREEFETWVKKQNAGEFRGQNYDVVERSCIIWAIEASKFLGVTPPSNWKKLCAWAKEHKTFAGLVGSSGLSSRGSSHSSSGVK